MFALLLSYEDYRTGEKWARFAVRGRRIRRVLRYKTWQHAEREASRRFRWVTMPDRNTRLDSMDARVVRLLREPVNETDFDAIEANLNARDANVL